ncbi:MAG: sugar isomerase [Cryobacterium sp.]|jgi:fructoselysine-6-P-deglycase FrlB-like protein|nr:sugar isomerase [Cryobacterium sp.]
MTTSAEPKAGENVNGEHMASELMSQPDTWARALTLRTERALLPEPGRKVAVIGCGTSWFMAQSYAVLRERSGQGITDAFAASEAFVNRDYDDIIALTRSGTTTEVLELVDANRGRTHVIGIVGDDSSPFVDRVDELIALPFADEKSVVQTRFATTALAFLRASLGEDLEPAIADARHAVVDELDDDLVASTQFTFLGRGWSVGLANEAALKMREASQSWTESYPAMEYRHGPISIAAPGRVTWMFGQAPTGIEHDVAATGARFVSSDLDPLAELIRAQKLALLRARAQGLNPDLPRNLTRSVILDS